MPTLSQRANRIQPQPMFRILAEAQEVERAGHPVIHLEIGDTSSFTGPELPRLLRENQELTASFGYSPSAGESVLRDILAQQYTQECRVPFRRENVVITPANAAISQLLAVLCDAGDRVLLPDPAFSTYQLAIRFNELVPVFFSLREEAGFAPYPADIRARLDADPGIRALVIDNPSNPLGINHAPDVMDELASLCADRDVALILDQTYKNLIYSGPQRQIRHQATNFYIYSLSKDAAAPALRVGCVVGDPAIITKVADYNSLFYSCLPKPLQLAAVAYLQNNGKQETVLHRAIKERIETATTLLRPCSWISFVKPNAAIYIYLNIARTGLDSETFATRLLHERAVCVCPGMGFGPSGHYYVRICLSGKEDALYAGCRTLVEFADMLGSCAAA